MIDVVCDACGKISPKKESDITRTKRHFCNRVCYGKWRSTQQLGENNKNWTGGQKTSICEYCKKEFPHYVHNSHKKQIFCSDECYNLWRKEQSQKNIVVCIVCGKHKQSTPYRLKHGKDKTCSKPCEAILKSKLRLKEGNPNWNNGSSQEEYCPKFNKPFREGVRAVWNYTCGLCKKPQSDNIVLSNGKERVAKLSVHHVHYVKSACCEGDKNNWHFVPVCAECHGKTNGHREEYEQIFAEIILNERGGKSYLTEPEYLSFFAKKRLDSQITVGEFLQTSAQTCECV